MSQNDDIGLSFCFIVCRRWKLGKKYKKFQKLPVFCHKTKALTKKSETQFPRYDCSLYTLKKCVCASGILSEIFMFKK